MSQDKGGYRFGVKCGWLYYETTISVQPSPRLAAVAPRLALAHAQRKAEDREIRKTKALMRR